MDGRGRVVEARHGDASRARDVDQTDERVARAGDDGSGPVEEAARKEDGVARVLRECFVEQRELEAAAAVACVRIDHRFGTSRPNFEILELGQIDVDSVSSNYAHIEVGLEI